MLKVQCYAALIMSTHQQASVLWSHRGMLVILSKEFDIWRLTADMHALQSHAEGAVPGCIAHGTYE